MKPLIVLENVTKYYGSAENEIKALDGISLTIMPGDLVAIVGPSGSGKSTLMHLIGALDVPTSGTVSIAGQEVGKLSRAELPKLRAHNIGFVFQGFNLLATRTALENVMEAAIYGGLSRRNAEEAALGMLEEVGLSDRSNHFPNQLSGGQQQRVAIARALVNKPGLILGDEPTGELDSRNAELIMELLLRLNRERAQTVVLVTHNPEVASLCRTVITVRDGKISDISTNNHV